MRSVDPKSGDPQEGLKIIDRLKKMLGEAGTYLNIDPSLALKKANDLAVAEDDNCCLTEGHFHLSRAEEAICSLRFQLKQAREEIRRLREIQSDGTEDKA